MSHEPYIYEETTAESIDRDALCSLYKSVGWSVYASDPDLLMAAVAGSDFVLTATIHHTLIGIIRCVSDDVSSVYIQDIIVHPDHQNQGIGRELMEQVLKRFDHVRQKVLLTDDHPGQLHFYASLGFQNTRDLIKTPLNAFVIIKGVTLA